MGERCWELVAADEVTIRQIVLDAIVV